MYDDYALWNSSFMSTCSASHPFTSFATSYLSTCRQHCQVNQFSTGSVGLKLSSATPAAASVRSGAPFFA